MRLFTTFIFLLFAMNLLQAQQVIPLYPKGIPNSKKTPNEEKEQVRENGTVIVSNITVPTLTVFLPEKPADTHTAVVICPGGGYHINAIKHEGLDIARRLNEWGIAAFVLKYRLPSDETMVNKEIGPLQDAQQAIHIVRTRAKEWNIDPNRVGIMGFSAGGHLASTAATHYKKPVAPDAKNANVRPDFVVLGYPVVSFTDSIGHVGSRDNLIGKSPSPAKIREYSNELHVTSDTPPAFLIHASDDKTVPPANSIEFYQSLLRHGVPAELHIYERGGHGFGMDNPTTEEDWMSSLHNWLVSRQLLPSR